MRRFRPYSFMADTVSYERFELTLFLRIRMWKSSKILIRI